MMVKSTTTRSGDLSYWNVTKSFNNNEMEDVDNEERSIAFSVNLLLKHKNISQPNLLRLPSHFITSENCSCHRSFHIFCTDLFHENDQDIEMIHIHPAPRTRERDSSRRILSPYKKYNYHQYQEDNDRDRIGTPISELTTSENQLFDKKLHIPPKLLPRTPSLNVPATSYSFQRSFQPTMKYSSSSRVPNQSTTNTDLQIRALSLFDQSLSASQLINPRGPPPSPKTPTYDSSMILLNPIIQAPLRAVPIIPHVRNSNENEKKKTTTSSVKITNYQDHVRDYLSSSDYSDNEKAEDNDHDDDKDLNQLLTIKKPKVPVRKQSSSKPGTSLRDRLVSHNNNRYLSLAEVYYSSFDLYKHFADKSRRALKTQIRLTPSTNETDDTLTTTTKTVKTTTTKTTATTSSVSQSKSVFGFSKTASSMHFGHAAGRLGLQASFEKWPQPLSHRTSIERKQEVTALRLVTLPLVTS